MFHNTKNNWTVEQEILDHCNSTLQKDVLMVMYKDTYKKIKFLSRQKNNLNFITWICPQLSNLIIMTKAAIF